jgi:hypothetical protein
MNIFQKAQLVGSDPDIVRRDIDLFRAHIPEEADRFTQLAEHFFDLKIHYLDGIRTPQVINELNIVMGQLRDYVERMNLIQRQYRFITVW